MPDKRQRHITVADLANRSFATVPEVAAILEYDRRTVRDAIKSGEIPAVKAGATYRVPVAWLRRAASGETDQAKAAV